MNRQEKIASSLVGGALGDALGYSREFTKINELLGRLPGRDWRNANFNNVPSPRHFRDQFGRAMISDDTQMTIATGRALLATRDAGDPDFAQTFADELSRKYVAWSKHPDNTRAPGNACMRACDNLSEGQHWSQATDINTMGCGANMRVAPIALFGYTGSLIDLAYLSSAITHAHPAALASAALTVAAIQAAYNGMQGTEILDFLINICRKPGEYPMPVLGHLWEQSEHGTAQQYLQAGYELCKSYLTTAREAVKLGWRGQTDPCDITGQAWTAPEALGGAMLCVAGLWDNPMHVIQRAAVSNGDSDSLAAIAGNIRGAAGVDWHRNAVAQLEVRPTAQLFQLAKSL